jgi:hypothetical protein
MLAVMHVADSHDETDTTAGANADRSPSVLIGRAPHSHDTHSYDTRETLEKELDESRRSEAWLRKIIDFNPTLAWCNLLDGSNEFLRMRAEHLDELKAQIAGGSTIAPDLEEVSLVDVDVVRGRHPSEHCSPYVKDWMRKRRVTSDARKRPPEAYARMM